MAGFTKTQQLTFLVGTFCGVLPISNIIFSSDENNTPQFRWFSKSTIWTLAVFGFQAGAVMFTFVWTSVNGVKIIPEVPSADRTGANAFWLYCVIISSKSENLACTCEA
jgi:hypothetical protein